MYESGADRIGEETSKRIQSVIKSMKDGAYATGHSYEWADLEIKLAILDALCDIAWCLENIPV